MALAGSWKHPEHKGGERFALLILSMYAEAKQTCGIKELIEETGMSLRQILRIVEDLKASGAVVTEGGKGRAPYIISLASANHDKMASQAPSSDDKKSQDIMASDVRSDDKMSSLSGATTLCQDKPTGSGDILSGTPIAPYSDIRTSTDREDANASSAQDAVSLKTYIGRLIQFRENELGTKLPNHQAEAAAAKWMFGVGWSYEDVTACYHFLVGGGKKWRQSGVTLNDVKSQIADWKKGNLSDGTRTEPRPAKQTRADVLRDERDYSVFRPGGGRGDAGGDSRPVPILAGVAAPQKR